VTDSHTLLYRCPGEYLPMNFAEVEATKFDVCVVGSGASGGIAAKELCEQGAKVCVLEIGEWKDPAKDFQSHVFPFELPYHGLRGEYTKKLYGDPQIFRHSNAVPDSAPYIILPAVGGKTLLWAGHSWRFGPRDFRSHALRGAGEDWPFGYDDLAPYYDRAEAIMGVCGARDGLEVIPDGRFLPPLKFRCGELRISRTLSQLGPTFKMISTRKAINTVPYGGRPPCHYCGRCMKGCDVDAKYTSANTAIPAALKTGRCTLVTGAIASRVLLDSTASRAGSVIFVEVKSRRERRVRCRVVALACGPVESARLLLLSVSKTFPQGLGNGSGEVGKNLQSTINLTTEGYLNSLLGSPVVNDDGTDSFHGTIPNPYYEKPHADFPNGYLINVGSGLQLTVSTAQIDFASVAPGFGQQYKKKVRAAAPAFVALGCQGQTMASASNFVDLDPEVRDGFGLPAIRLHFRVGNYELAMMRDMRAVTRAIVEAAEGVVINPGAAGGVDASHYVGTCRMGTDPARSVLNEHCQSHDVKNLFIVDGSSFPYYPEKNPTETVIAVSLRAAEYLGEQLRKGNL
jgi:choline dehydrogenase-like flavoprotein